ncbi:MAG TPA: sulfatase-like hydrolase/transferase [Solirubrobacteraceae bacterium]|nr:sulfatase-like hydrolase/transferase [Solirubrobacteraceae bacterium]
MARRALALAAALAGLAGLACLVPAAGAADPARTPVVVVVFDEFPAASLLDRHGDLDVGRFPGFAAFARSSTWFSDTTTVADGTRWAAPALLGARYPDRLRMPAWFDHTPNLITLLARTHRVRVTEPVTRLCPPAVCRRELPGRTRGERARALTELIPRAKRAAAERSALARWIRRIQPWRRGRPPLYVIHVLLPHHPWMWRPDGRRYPLPSPAMPGLLGDNMWGGDADLVDQGWKRHLLQVGYTDRLVRRLIRRLRRVGLWDRALVALVADHGASFVPGHSRRSATPATVGGIAPVPFFVKAPAQRRGLRYDFHVETVDVLPTLLAALGMPLRGDLEGRPALVPGYAPRDRVDLWATTSVLGFGHRSYPLAAVHRATRRVLARQHARFGSGPMTGRFWADPFAPVRR